MNTLSTLPKWLQNAINRGDAPGSIRARTLRIIASERRSLASCKAGHASETQTEDYRAHGLLLRRALRSLPAIRLPR